MNGVRLSAGLIAASAAAAVGAAALNGKGVKDLFNAQKRNAAADERYQARVTESSRRHDETNDRVAALGHLQGNCFAAVVDRMRDFLRRHDKQVRDSERLLLDGLDVTTQLLERPRSDQAADIGAWAVGTAGSVLVGVGTGAAVNQITINYGVAGTGRKISTLAGAAKERAAKAFAGGGPKANGGGGIARGELVLKAVTFSSGLLASGVVTAGIGTKALTEAQEHETKVAIECADLDLADSSLDAVDQRITEITTVLNRLTDSAVTELNVLESVPFDVEQHAPQLQKALMLVLAVRDVATTPLLTTDGDLDERSAKLTVKYRPMLKESDDDQTERTPGGRNRRGGEGCGEG